MYKKLIVPLILALVATMAFSNVAFAASSATVSSTTGRQVGTIVAIDRAANTIKVANNSGQKITIHLDANTTYKGKVSSQAELTTGMYVNIKTKQASGGLLMATSINVLKTKVNLKISGQIIDKHASSFTLKGTDGKTYTFDITSRTTYSGHGVASYGGLAAGMKVKVTYNDLTNGTMTAKSVVVLRTK